MKHNTHYYRKKIHNLLDYNTMVKHHPNAWISKAILYRFCKHSINGLTKQYFGLAMYTITGYDAHNNPIKEYKYPPCRKIINGKQVRGYKGITITEMAYRKT